MNNITIVIPVKNEAKNLLRCIEAVRSMGPVVVVDSGSTDDTQAVAQAAGAEVLDFEWDGQFPKKRNWTLRNYDFKTKWVLFLDADEFVSPEFIQEVQAAIQSTEHAGFWLNFSNFFMDQELRGGDAFRKLALFRVGAGEYEKIDEEIGATSTWRCMSIRCSMVRLVKLAHRLSTMISGALSITLPSTISIHLGRLRAIGV